jgi:hypothetical protein
MLEAGVGWLVLPGAELCGQRGEDPRCRRGDSSLSLEAWQLFRLSSPFALGAGATMALLPTTSVSRPEPEGIERDHTRAYLTVEATARWYPWIEESFEGWLGIASGLAVVSDRYVVVSEEAKPLIGPAGVTIRSEGFSLGVGGGAAFQLAPGWSVGGALRVGSWFLPSRPSRSALGDEASLTGQITTVVAAVNLAYRLRL